MKASQIQVGGQYTAKVSGRLVTVRVDAIRETERYVGNYGYNGKYVGKTVYDVTNLATGRKTTFRSAAKFRGPSAQQIHDERVAKLIAHKNVRELHAAY